MWKVMIVDDEKLICKLVQALVEWDKLGMQMAAQAENAIQALDMLQQYRPDILITDIRMPGMDGLELIKNAKKICPELEIIIISGYAHFEYARNALSLGVGNYLLKPIKQDELNETLRKIGERLDAKKSAQGMEMAERRVSESDVNRLRYALLKDLVEDAYNPTAVQLQENYYFKAEADCYQAIVVKAGYDPEQMSKAAQTVICEKTKELFYHCLSKNCNDCLFDYVKDSGYGILNFIKEDTDKIRTLLLEFLRQLEANRSMLGPVRFSLAIGGVTVDAEQLTASIRKAELAIRERIVEGWGRLLEEVPPASGLPMQDILDRYCKEMEHAIEVLDPAEASKCGEELKNAVMSVPDVRGREIQETVLSAGRFFIVRVRATSPTIFEEKCMHGGSAEELFHELSTLQEELMTEALEARQGETSRPIRQAKQYVHKHYAENITLEEVCDHVGFSVAYFSALFKKETGEGFAKYLMRVRMDEAKTLLRETGLSVTEICERVGYNDRKHFTQTFHKIAGVNPAEYRKLYG